MFDDDCFLPLDDFFSKLPSRYPDVTSRMHHIGYLLETVTSKSSVNIEAGLGRIIRVSRWTSPTTGVIISEIPSSKVLFNGGDHSIPWDEMDNFVLLTIVCQDWRQIAGIDPTSEFCAQLNAWVQDLLIADSW